MFKLAFGKLGILYVVHNYGINRFNDYINISYSPLTPEQRDDKCGIVMFRVEDNDFMGLKNTFISESFIHFKDIPLMHEENDLDNTPQIKLKLTSPKHLGSYLMGT